jgi:hypothetical protein
MLLLRCWRKITNINFEKEDIQLHSTETLLPLQQVTRAITKPQQLYLNTQAQENNLFVLDLKIQQQQQLANQQQEQQSIMSLQFMNNNEQFTLSPFEFEVSDQLFDTKTAPMMTHSTSLVKTPILMNSPMLSPFMITPPTSPIQQQKFDSYFNNVLSSSYLNNEGTNITNIMSGTEQVLSPGGLLMDFNDISDNFLLRDGWHHHHHSAEQVQVNDPPPAAIDKGVKPPKLKLPVVDISDGNIAKMIPSTTTTKTTTTKTATATKKRTTTTTTSKKKAAHEPPTTSSTSLLRGWKTIYADKQFEDKFEVELSSKTRCEDPCPEVPSKMYSSLKYEIRHHASGSLCDQVQFILARITVVDSLKFQEIKKDNKPVLKGVVEAALSKPPGSDVSERLYGVLKCQFTDVSYHHKKSDFCWQISFFRPDDLVNPIMIKRSAPYQVFARKPATNKKRKRDAEETFSKFQDGLDLLLQDAKKMKVDDKQRAMELLCSKMLEMDSNFFASKFGELQQQLEEAQD